MYTPLSGENPPDARVRTGDTAPGTFGEQEALEAIDAARDEEMWSLTETREEANRRYRRSVRSSVLREAGMER